jgi:hypothetical protein
LDSAYAAPDEKGYAPLGVKGGLDKLNQKLTEIVQLAHEQNARIYFLIYPWPAQLARTDNYSWFSHASKLCKNTSCDGVINVIEKFRMLSKATNFNINDYYQRGDVHFTKKGNEIVKQSLLEHFSKIP